MAQERYNKQLHTWVPHHADCVKRRLEFNIYPTLGKRPIDQIESPELLQAIRKIEARGSYGLAHCEHNEIRGAYNRAEYLPERKRMMQHWANYLDSVEVGGEIILLHGNAA